MIFWQEKTSADQFQVPNDIVDIVFDIECRELPVDHAYALASAILNALPWMENATRVGIHAVHVAGSQNGWERPGHNSKAHLILSHRTKLVLRIPTELQATLQAGLSGMILDIAGYTMQVGRAKIKPLSKHTTLFARYVEITNREDENIFLQWVANELNHLNIQMRKALCGKIVTFVTPKGTLMTRSLLIAELSLEESIRLQQHGLGEHQKLGCGIFVPHKGINAVQQMVDE